MVFARLPIPIYVSHISKAVYLKEKYFSKEELCLRFGHKGAVEKDKSEKGGVFGQKELG